MFGVLNILDLIFLLLAIIVTLNSTVKGFLHEFFSTAAWLVSLIVCFLFYKSFARVLAPHIKNPAILYLLSFLLLFIASYIAIKLLHIFLSGILSSPSLSSFDHALGFFLGLVKSLLLIILVIFILCFQKFFPIDALLSESLIASQLLPLIEKILPTSLEWARSYV